MGEKRTASDINSIVEESTQHVRKAMDSYFDFFKKSLPELPLGNNEVNRKILAYAAKNAAQAFGYAEKLSSAKDISEIIKIQTEFLQSQMTSLSEQTKDISDATAKAVSTMLQNPFSKSS
jgi:hypothetical protein